LLVAVAVEMALLLPVVVLVDLEQHLGFLCRGVPRLQLL
jgi:hypothetical protein